MSALHEQKPPLQRFYAWSFVTSLGFFGPVLIVYLLDRGLSISEVFVLQSIYMLGILAMEVPTGSRAPRDAIAKHEDFHAWSTSGLSATGESIPSITCHNKG